MSDGSPPPLDALRAKHNAAVEHANWMRDHLTVRDMDGISAVNLGWRLRETLDREAALLARVDELERERDAALNRCDLAYEAIADWRGRAEVAEAEVARLTALTVGYKADQDCQRAEVARLTDESEHWQDIAQTNADACIAVKERLLAAQQALRETIPYVEWTISETVDESYAETGREVLRRALAAVGRDPAQEDKP